MLPFASMSTPVALLHAVMPWGNVTQLSTNRYDPESAAIDGRLAANWSTTAANTTAIRTRLITGSFSKSMFGRCNPTRSGAIDVCLLKISSDHLHPAIESGSTRGGSLIMRKPHPASLNTRRDGATQGQTHFG